MIRRAEPKTSAAESKQFSPEGTKKYGSPIRNDASRETMVLADDIEEYRGNFEG